MPIHVLILKEDFHTRIRGSENLGIIEINEDFYEFCRVAHDVKCDLLSAIDVEGISVFNHDQRKIIEPIIKQLCQYSNFKSIIEVIQNALDLCQPHYGVYIVLLGNFDGKESMIQSYVMEQ